MNPDIVRNAVRQALAEDTGTGDITTNALVPADAKARAYIGAKQPCVLAGLDLARATFLELDPHFQFTPFKQEGDLCQRGDRVCELAGLARALLTGERTALNFVQQLSGVATLTRTFVEAIGGPEKNQPAILDTRKTTPGLRVLEKYAVTVGGGQNHRKGLFDQVLIKDNHLMFARRLSSKPIVHAVTEARKANPRVLIEVETRNLDEVQEAIDSKADIIMLDNMTPAEMKEAVRLVGGRAKTEASGGVTLQTIAAIAATGVDTISVGALTHSAPAIDFSLEFIE
ncbi:MAG: carboxylating nicotinate-nucleotide diphosphorylase [Verrucomicrobiae bacterium]|nr:carboxylating nicotinate-nucleotide diphosphorylase [Verrucomicrobiae bacterium]